MSRIIHDLIQGSDAWLQFRAQHFGASECAAMLGLSKTTTRTQLLHMKHTGLGKEFSDWVQTHILDHGHEVEGMARPHIEALIGQDLYPVTCSDGEMSASCDGLTMDDVIAMEHKQWAEALAAQVRAGVMPEEHMPQCQQIMMVTGAQKVIFVVSNGTPEKMERIEVLPDPRWFTRIRAGWAQFAADLAAYVPPAHSAVERIVAEPVESLPAPVVQVTGQLTLQDNFKVFEQKLRDFLEHRLIREPKSDEDFVNLDAQIKSMKQAREAVKGAKAQMLAQVQPIDMANKTADMLDSLLQQSVSMAEKLLTAEKDRRKGEIVAGGVSALKAHIEGLNKRLGQNYMPAVPADFGGCIKGLKSLTSMEDKVSTELARAKIAANEIADRIAVNMQALVAAGDAAHFPDAATLVLKATDDLRAIIAARVAETERKLAAQREAIRAEEKAKAEKAARDRLAVEQRATQASEDALIASFQENARRIEFDSVPYIQKAIGTYESVAKDWENDSRPRVLAAFLAGRAYLKERLEVAQARQQAEAAKPALPPAAAPIASPASVSQALNVVPMGTRAPAAPTSAPTLTLGQINERIGLAKWSEADLTALGFPPAATRQNTKLYHDADFGRMLDSAVAHLRTVQAKQQRAA